MKSKAKLYLILIPLLILIPFIPSITHSTPNRCIIYSTDLFADGDFDDYFDIVSLYSLDIDNLYIILDDGKIQNDETLSGISESLEQLI